MKESDSVVGVPCKYLWLHNKECICAVGYLQFGNAGFANTGRNSLDGHNDCVQQLSQITGCCNEVSLYCWKLLDLHHLTTR